MSVGQAAEKKKPYALLVGKDTGAATMENGMEAPQEIKNRVTTLAGAAQWTECQPVNQRVRFDSQSGHMPGLQDARGLRFHTFIYVQEDQCFSHTSMFLFKKRIELPYDPEISLLGIYQNFFENTYSQRYMHFMFIAALFAVARTWRQPTVSFNGGADKEMWSIYTTTQP